MPLRFDDLLLLRERIPWRDLHGLVRYFAGVFRNTVTGNTDFFQSKVVQATQCCRRAVPHNIPQLDREKTTSTELQTMEPFHSTCFHTAGAAKSAGCRSFRDFVIAVACDTSAGGNRKCDITSGYRLSVRIRVIAETIAATTFFSVLPVYPAHLMVSN